jgi:hypothetical protein
MPSKKVPAAAKKSPAKKFNRYAARDWTQEIANVVEHVAKRALGDEKLLAPEAIDRLATKIADAVGELVDPEVAAHEELLDKLSGWGSAVIRPFHTLGDKLWSEKSQREAEERARKYEAAREAADKKARARAAATKKTAKKKSPAKKSAKKAKPKTPKLDASKLNGAAPDGPGLEASTA